MHVLQLARLRLHYVLEYLQTALNDLKLKRHCNSVIPLAGQLSVAQVCDRLSCRLRTGSLQPVARHRSLKAFWLAFLALSARRYLEFLLQVWCFAQACH